ncbi:hypothetical protein [Dyella terrae]|uniref:hypothetical protein n=1 Tax=Dyella terrae TaxID=522259 RepID=UPI001EFEC996|nr:hypothetical protein [Dyella terrae]ULU25383.1 hypothetical protein DYST_02310 [Dyella terrae]
MKAVTTLLVLTLAAVGARAADNDATLASREYTDVVAPAEQEAYEAGIKAYNQCLGQHGFKYDWTAWTHETGDTYSYTYTTASLPWSAFDAMRTASKACDQTLRTAVNPHLKSETSAFTQKIGALSHLPQGAATEQPFAEVNYFKLKSGHEPQEAFMDVMQKVTAAAEKSHWNYYYAISALRDADGNSPEFIMIIRSASWADLGKEPDVPLWTMVEKVYGKDSAQAMRKSLNEALLYETVRIDSYNADLTYKANGK